MLKNIFRKKGFNDLEKDVPQGKMNRVLTVKDLVYIGVAGVIGAGMFTSVGRATYAGGPGVTLLFVLIGIVCIFISLCYAEFASRIPLTGSSYSYAYYVFGEFVAWLVGWILIIEYSLSNIIIAISWSSYFKNVLDGFSIHIPEWLTIDRTTAYNAYQNLLQQGQDVSTSIWATAPEIFGAKIVLNLPAFLIVFLIGGICYVGIKESKNYSKWMVYIKLSVLLFFVIVGFFTIDFSNYHPFLPNGFSGVMHGVSAIFFAYIGFEAVSTLAEETVNPQRDLPRGMFYTILICSVVYIIVSFVLAGIVNYKELNVSDPLAFAFEQKKMAMVSYIISSLSLIASSSTLLVYQISQPRLWMNMSRDGLLPKIFSTINKRFLTPSFSTIISTFLIATPTLFVDPYAMTDITSIGTLFTFAVISFGVLYLPKDNNFKGFQNVYINSRYVLPPLYAGFLFVYSNRIFAFFQTTQHQYSDILFIGFLVVAAFLIVLASIKNYSLIPVLSTLLCLYLMIEIPPNSWIVFFIWVLLGCLIYFFYGYKKSKLNNTFS